MEQPIVEQGGSVITFRKICQQNGLTLTEEAIEKLAEYIVLLKDWNTKINLISRRDSSDAWFSHILHSVSILFFIDIPNGSRILDLGTGGGLPGIPISIVRPDLKITLLDSIRKKTFALTDIVERLKLQNVQIITGRVEEIANQGSGKRFDSVFSRAVAPLTDLIKWSRPLISSKKGSSTLPALVALKGGDLDDEIETARIKTGIASIDVMSLVFEGSAEIGLEDKKLIMVRV